MATETKRSDEKPVTDKKPIVQNLRGVVKWFNVRSGYGFIQREDNKEDVFVHHSSIVSDRQQRYYSASLGESESVEFDLVQGEKGLEAMNVTGPDGQTVKGSSYGKYFGGRGGFRSRGRRFRRGNNFDESNNFMYDGPSPRGDGSAFYADNGRRRGGRRGFGYYPRRGNQQIRDQGFQGFRRPYYTRYSGPSRGGNNYGINYENQFNNNNLNRYVERERGFPRSRPGGRRGRGNWNNGRVREPGFKRQENDNHFQNKLRSESDEEFHQNGDSNNN